MTRTDQSSIYLPFFGLKRPPFAMSPDPRLFFRSHTHLETLASLIYGVRERKGFILLTGNVGTGKTMLLRTLLESIDPNVVFSHIINTDVNFIELLQMILSDFGLPIAGRSKVEMTDALFTFLVDTRLEGKVPLVVVDEAQNLTPEVLESLRMLSNLETPRHKLMQILLCGQPELRVKLRQGSLRQLAQRIAVSCELKPFQPREVERYIHQRIKMSGGDSSDIFPHAVIERIAELSGGVPRLINILCDSSLLLAFAEGSREVTAKMLEQAADNCIGLDSIAQEPVAGLREEPEAADKEKGVSRTGSLLRRIAMLIFLILMILAFGFLDFGGGNVADRDAVPGKAEPRQNGAGVIEENG